jgi:hypothetical protein
MGFGSELAERAVTATHNEGLQAALDWLLSQTTSAPASRATTPRAGSAAARPETATPGSDTNAQALLDEECMLAAAIQESLGPQSAAQASLTDEEQLQLALTASIVDNDKKRRTSEEDVRVPRRRARAAHLHARNAPARAKASDRGHLPCARSQLAHQLALLQATPGYMLDEPEPEPDDPPPPLPAAFSHDAQLEDALKRRLDRSGTSALVIAKAAVILRRRASVARARSISGVSGVPGQPLITADGETARARANTVRGRLLPGLPPGLPPGVPQGRTASQTARASGADPFPARSPDPFPTRQSAASAGGASGVTGGAVVAGAADAISAGKTFSDLDPSTLPEAEVPGEGRTSPLSLTLTRRCLRRRSQARVEPRHPSLVLPPNLAIPGPQPVCGFTIPGCKPRPGRRPSCAASSCSPSGCATCASRASRCATTARASSAPSRSSSTPRRSTTAPFAKRHATRLVAWVAAADWRRLRAMACAWAFCRADLT